MTKKDKKRSPQALLKLAAKGDKQAYGAFYEEYFGEIYRYIYFRVSSHHEAEDLTEIVFLKAWETLHQKGKEIQNFRAWIYRIAHNIVIDHHRTKKHEVSLDHISPAAKPESGPEKLIEIKQENQKLMDGIAQLEPKYREVIVLRFINQLSHAETAKVLNIKEGHVRVLQYRGLKILSDLMTEDRKK